MALARPYVAWMRATAIQAEQEPVRRAAAQAAYETAFAAIVPPPLIEATIARGLTSLVTHNVFGQNTHQSRHRKLNTPKCGPKTPCGHGCTVTRAPRRSRPKVRAVCPAAEHHQPIRRGDAVVRIAKAAGTSAGAAQSAISGADAHLPNTLLGPHLAPVVRVDRRRDPGAGMVHQLVSADITAVLAKHRFAIFAIGSYK